MGPSLSTYFWPAPLVRFAFSQLLRQFKYILPYCYITFLNLFAWSEQYAFINYFELNAIIGLDQLAAFNQILRLSRLKPIYFMV